MATFVLLHGAGSDPWYWHLVAPELRDRGHDVVTPDLPVDDDTAGLPDYVDAAVDGHRRPRAISCSSPSRWPGSSRPWCANGCRST